MKRWLVGWGLGLAGVAVSLSVCAEQGTVREIVDSKNGYLYVRVDKTSSSAENAQNEWLAVNDDMTLKPGDTLSFDDGMVVSSFRSEALQRSFATLRFVMEAKVIEHKAQSK